VVATEKWVSKGNLCREITNTRDSIWSTKGEVELQAQAETGDAPWFSSREVVVWWLPKLGDQAWGELQEVPDP